MMSRGGGGGGTSGKLHLVSWLWRGPRRALRAARDLYVRSLTGCAGHIPGDAAAFGYPVFPEYSFSASSSRRSYADADADDNDLRELIRAASQRRQAEAAASAAAAEPPPVVPRSQSVAMARIDEDRPCEFGAAAAEAVFLPRSRSYAAGGAGRRRGGRVAAQPA